MNEEGGDDSPPPPKRKIKKVMVVSSSSESDSEDSVGVTRTRRKKLRVVSEEESSDSSGSSVVCGARRRRTLPKLRDSDAESDRTGWASDRSTSKQVASTSKPTSGFASDSSEGNSDKCSICLLRFTNQEIGTPINCEHIFCLDCITEWSKNVNTCPVDRITFESIVVRACAGGRVLRTEPVKVVERRPSVDILVVEDPTVCEICGRADHEESMLLCDACDLGFHMQCLSPPLTEVPAEQWLCPNCDGIFEDINLSEVEDLLTGIADISRPLGPRPAPLRVPRNVRRSARTQSNPDQPSTSSGHRGSRLSIEDIPTSSRSATTTNRNRSVITRRAPKRKRPSRRRTRKVVIEYEVEEDGKFPVTRRVTRTVRRKKTRKRQPRTAARRSHVRASVRAKLTSMKVDQDLTQASSAGVQNLRVSRQRAGIPALSIYGNSNQLEYFSDDDHDVSEGASTAVAIRPTSSILSAYRQARRKMVTIPSPPHASSAPDVLSNILESQTLLHSKNSVVSISVDGNVNIKLQKSRSVPTKKPEEPKREEKLDLKNGEEAVKKAPSYPGQSRGGGGWGGGYRGSYHRDQNTNNFNRGNYDNNYGGSYQNRQGNNMFNNYQNNINNNMRRDSEPEFFDNYPRRPHQFPHAEDSHFDRARRNAPNDANRPQNFSNTPRFNEPNQGRYSLGPPWQPYGNAPPASRQDVPPAAARHSFGGFENPLDMRMGQMPPRTSSVDSFPRAELHQADKSQPRVDTPPYQPLAQSQNLNFPKSGELEKSEDEKSDSGLVIDTEKYDPTDPTNDDDSGDDQKDLPEPSTASLPRVAEIPVAGPPPALPALPSTPPAAPAPPRTVQSILAGIDTSSMNVPPNVLDNAVRQVLKEHRNLIVPAGDAHANDKSDEDSDSDCPNFSIYSATSVHIANNTSSLTDEVEVGPPQPDGLEDLVQEDDDPPRSPHSPRTPRTPSPSHSDREETSKPVTPPSVTKSVPPVPANNDTMSKTQEEYKEKVSKRCPITTNTRNPIKIKLNTPSLIKRVSLYDEEDTSQDVAIPDKSVTPEKLPPSPKLNKDSESLFNDDNEIKENKEQNDKKVNNIKEKRTSESDEETHPTDKNEKDLRQSKVSENNTTRDTDVEDEKENGVHCDEKSHGDNQSQSDRENDLSDCELPSNVLSPKDTAKDKDEENVEKMTESISETEDERSYTPCLDENKPRDASFDNDKDKGLEGLDTEMISEEEGNEMFSENEQPSPGPSQSSPPRPQPAEVPASEVVDKKKIEKKKSDTREESKKKKKKESKKEGKDKGKSKKKIDIAFKKLSKNGKERNYRERDKDDKKKKDRRSSSEAPDSKKRRKEKRKDLERYDVRTVVTEKRRKVKDPFGRDVSPRGRSPSLSRSPRPSPDSKPPRRRPSPARARRSASRGRRSISRARRSISRARRSISRARRSISRAHVSPRRRTPSRPRRSPIRRSVSRLTPIALRESPRPRRSPRRPRRSPSGRSPSPHRSVSPRRRSPQRKRRRRSGSRARRRRSASGSPRAHAKKKKRLRDRTASPPRRRVDKSSPHRKVRRSASRSVELSPARPIPSPSLDSQLLSPRTPPPEPPEDLPLRLSQEELAHRRRRDPDRLRRRPRDVPGPSKEVFTSGDNILVSVSFKDQQRGEEEERRRRRENKRDRRRRRRNPPPPEAETAKPVAIIDLDRSPFRELTPSPKNVIVLSDSEPGEKEAEAAPAAAAPAPAPVEPFTAGPKTPPEPSDEASGPPVAAVAGTAVGAAEPAAEEPQSPDAYDPFEPTRSASASPASGASGASRASAASPAAPPSPPRALMTLESAQRTNMSADDVLDRRPLSPAEKVMALLQSTRDTSPEPPPVSTVPPPDPDPPAPRIVLPSPTRAPAKLFPGKPSPIKSNPVKPMARPPSDGGASPYSPGESDFADLFEPPARRRRLPPPPLKPHAKKSKTQVGVKIDDENLKILDDLPSSAVEMQVKSKFLKKLNRQERVVEEVKLVLKPHYNKKHVTKDEYKHILRRAVPKICHNKTGEINPAKIQSLVEAYVRKFRKRRKLGLA